MQKGTEMQKKTELQDHDFNVGNVYTYLYIFEIHILNNVWSRIMDSIKKCLTVISATLRP